MICSMPNRTGNLEIVLVEGCGDKSCLIISLGALVEIYFRLIVNVILNLGTAGTFSLACCSVFSGTRKAEISTQQQTVALNF